MPRHLPPLLLAALTLAGCGEGGLLGNLRTQTGREGPDEFLVLPTRPLELPPDLTALPPPTPGATNRVEYVPEVEVTTALSGRPPQAEPGAPGLVAGAGPAQPGVRTTLAREDAEFRRSNQPRLLERWFRRDRSRLVYEDQILDADAELERLRARGLRTPAAPPVAEEE